MYTEASVNIQVKITNIQIGSEERYCWEDKMYAKQSKANPFLEIYKKKNLFCTSKYSENIFPASKMSPCYRKFHEFSLSRKSKNQIPCFPFPWPPFPAIAYLLLVHSLEQLETESINSKTFHLHIHKQALLTFRWNVSNNLIDFSFALPDSMFWTKTPTSEANGVK